MMVRTPIRRLVLWVRAGFPLLLLTFPTAVLGEGSGYVRVGFSASMFSEVNQNDAIAAVRAWSRVFTDESNIASVPQPLVLNGMAEIEAALAGGTLDYVNLTMAEYAVIRSYLPSDTVTLGIVSGSFSDEYLLLTSEESGIASLEALRGKSLLLMDNSRSSLAAPWLDVLLMRVGLTPTTDFFGTVNGDTMIGKVLLPVFFGKADACVVTRSAFDTMVELNPQIGRKLKTIAVSRPLVPTVFCFTPTVDEMVKEKVSREITQWHLTVAGKQCLTIFQTDSIEEHPISVLSPTLDLLAEHERLMEGAAGEEAVNQKGGG